MKFTRADSDSNLTFTNFIEQAEMANNVRVAPQLAQYFHVGFGRPGGPQDTGNNRLGSLPFSKKMIIHGSHLYYLWANRTQFGVARKPAAGGTSQLLFSANRDTYQDGRGYNHAGCSFFIKDNKLFATVTYMNYGNMNSRYDDFYIDISST